MIPPELAACIPRTADHRPIVAPETIGAVIRVESGGRVLAIGVNGLPRNQQPHPRTLQEAVQIATYWTQRINPRTGVPYSVDLGLTQINSRNLAGLGYTIELALDACASVAAGARVLLAGYGRAVASVGEGQPALLMALSAYNTGDLWRGFANGYVAHYTGYTVPSFAAPLPAALMARPAAVRVVAAAPSASPRLSPLTADTTVAWGPGDPDEGGDR